MNYECRGLAKRMMGSAKSLGKIDSLFLLNVLAFPCTFRLLLFESLVGTVLFRSFFSSRHFSLTSHFPLARHVRCGGNKEIGNGAHDRKTVFCDCVLDIFA
jgi:hypothetical protein